MEIYLIRHGKTKYNEEHRFVGSTDLSLTDLGKKEIEELWANKSPMVEAIYSSPLKRCLETAEIIFPNMKPKIILKLHEMNFGIFEGHKEEDLLKLPEYNEFLKNMASFHIPNGESGISFMKRVKQGFLEVINDMEKLKISTSAILCHGGVIMALLALFCKESNELMHYWLSNGCFYFINYDKSKKEIIIKDRKCE